MFETLVITKYVEGKNNCLYDHENKLVLTGDILHKICWVLTKEQTNHLFELRLVISVRLGDLVFEDVKNILNHSQLDCTRLYVEATEDIKS